MSALRLVACEQTCLTLFWAVSHTTVEEPPLTVEPQLSGGDDDEATPAPTPTPDSGAVYDRLYHGAAKRRQARKQVSEALFGLVGRHADRNHAAKATAKKEKEIMSKLSFKPAIPQARHAVLNSWHAYALVPPSPPASRVRGREAAQGQASARSTARGPLPPSQTSESPGIPQLLLAQ